MGNWILILLVLNLHDLICVSDMDIEHMTLWQNSVGVRGESRDVRIEW